MISPNGSHPRSSQQLAISIGDVLGFIAYLSVVGGAPPDLNFLSAVLRQQLSQHRPQAEGRPPTFTIAGPALGNGNRPSLSSRAIGGAPLAAIQQGGASDADG